MIPRDQGPKKSLRHIESFFCQWGKVSLKFCGGKRKMIIIRAAELDGLRLLFLLPLLDGETMSSLIRQIKRCVHGAIFPDFSCCSSPSSPMSSSVFLPVSQVNTHNYSTLNQGRGGGVGSKVAAAREPHRFLLFWRELLSNDFFFA